MTVQELRSSLMTLNANVQEAHRVSMRALDLLDDLEDEIHTITTLEEITPLPELVQELLEQYDLASLQRTWELMPAHWREVLSAMRTLEQTMDGLQHQESSNS